ncbi:MAG: hypothetical protein ACRCT1_16875 [Microcoleaceae cyanobacterium]
MIKCHPIAFASRIIASNSSTSTMITGNRADKKKRDRGKDTQVGKSRAPSPPSERWRMTGCLSREARNLF